MYFNSCIGYTEVVLIVCRCNISTPWMTETIKTLTSLAAWQWKRSKAVAEEMAFQLTFQLGWQRPRKPKCTCALTTRGTHSAVNLQLRQYQADRYEMSIKIVQLFLRMISKKTILPTLKIMNWFFLRRTIHLEHEIYFRAATINFPMNVVKNN